MNNKLVNYNIPGCPGTEIGTNTIKGHKRTKRESIAEVIEENGMDVHSSVLNSSNL